MLHVGESHSYTARIRQTTPPPPGLSLGWGPPPTFFWQGSPYGSRPCGKNHQDFNQVLRRRAILFCPSGTAPGVGVLPLLHRTMPIPPTATPAANTTAAATTATALIGGDMGAYLINANVDGANVTVDKDFKGAIPGGKR